MPFGKVIKIERIENYALLKYNLKTLTYINLNTDEAHHDKINIEYMINKYEGENSSVKAAIETHQFIFECIDGISVFYVICY